MYEASINDSKLIMDMHLNVHMHKLNGLYNNLSSFNVLSSRIRNHIRTGVSFPAGMTGLMCGRFSSNIQLSPQASVGWSWDDSGYKIRPAHAEKQGVWMKTLMDNSEHKCFF